MTYYFDLSCLGGCVGIIANPGDTVVCTGTQIHREHAKYRDSAPVERFARESDLHFWFDDETPGITLYTVPKTEIGGYDSLGGLFVGSPGFTLSEAEPIYYVDRERRCFMITADSRELSCMGLSWREKMVPTDAVEVFADRAEAMEAYEIRIPKDDDDLLDMLKRIDESPEEQK